MSDSRKLITFVLLVFLSGCVSPRDIGGLKTLSSLGKDAEKQEAYLEHETDSYEKVKEALQAGKISIGTSRAAMLTSYGEPVIVMDENDESKFVYKPGNQNWFGGEKIYFWFDSGGNLSRWKCLKTDCPASS